MISPLFSPLEFFQGGSTFLQQDGANCLAEDLCGSCCCCRHWFGSMLINNRLAFEKLIMSPCVAGSGRHNYRNDIIMRQLLPLSCRGVWTVGATWDIRHQRGLRYPFPHGWLRRKYLDAPIWYYALCIRWDLKVLC